MTTRRLILAVVILSAVSIAPLAIDRIVATQVAAQTAAAQAPPAQQLINGYLPAPARRAGEGRGPFPTLTIRGVMVIDGTGAPPYGPMDVVIANNRIQSIRGSGGRAGGRGAAAPANNVIDATGMYMMPGFVDMHVHAG